MSSAAQKYVKHLKESPDGRSITRSEKLVLCLLADDHNEDKGCAWPSVESLAGRALMTRDNCRRVLRKLETLGLIESNPRLRENGGRSSSEYRFVELDQPFDVRERKVTEKRMLLQNMRLATRPVQESFLHPPRSRAGDPPANVRGGPQQKRGGDPSSRAGGTPAAVRGQELVFELPTELPGELSPTPKRGEDPLLGIQQRRFSRFKELLKSELYSIPGKLAARQGFEEIKPGENDYDAAFRDWWLIEARPNLGSLMLVTGATDIAATHAGIVKYEKRLQQNATKFFNGAKVSFVIQKGHKS